MKKTIKQKNLEFLMSRGWNEDTKKFSRKYTVMSKPGVDYYYFLGPYGAARRGSTIGNSISVKLRLDGPPTQPEDATVLPKSE